jgi:hypothetical protein
MSSVFDSGSCFHGSISQETGVHQKYETLYSCTSVVSQVLFVSLVLSVSSLSVKLSRVLKK